ncbi:MAG: hypothetical protein JRI23_15145 [Deltaproteobacteria bacterium]|jgi:hypothetical protein|nr:hypothetical protein [Deltaproteobacteria bacterium]MBW2533084.1 hypothetical protein [Deltaproteobacteria bacterium]
MRGWSADGGRGDPSPRLGTRSIRSASLAPWLISIGAVCASAGCGSSFSSGGDAPGEACQGAALQCQPDGTALECIDGTWTSLGPCPLGCDEQSLACHVPSNVDASLFSEASSVVVALPSSEPLVFDTDTGAISAGDDVLRPAGEGLDESSGVAFSVRDQRAEGPSLGVFTLAGLEVAAGAIARGVGNNALVLLVAGDVTIDGTFEVAADKQVPGPGGWAGGNPSAPGAGPGGGGVGQGVVVTDTEYCASSGGGGGFFGPGGSGGPCACAAPNDYAAGAAGATYGTEQLIPLIGGSGGAGGTIAVGNATESLAGPGGGGGGALQISATGELTIGSNGIVHAGGGGGGGCENASGAGGGAGGAILLEAPNVTVAVGAVLAANGGGGGGGDCA